MPWEAILATSGEGAVTSFELGAGERRFGCVGVEACSLGDAGPERLHGTLCLLQLKHTGYASSHYSEVSTFEGFTTKDEEPTYLDLASLAIGAAGSRLCVRATRRHGCSLRDGMRGSSGRRETTANGLSVS